MALTDVQRERFYVYSKANWSVFSDRVIQDFFHNEQNIELLLRGLDGEEVCQKELEDRFRKHLFRMRFVKFLISTIKYYTIGQMRLNHKNDTRNQLIFDRPVSDEGGGTLGELLLGKQSLQEYETVFNDPAQFQASFSNEHLSQAFAALSQKQQLITTFYYALCYQDNEISRIIGVSQQAVCKTRNLALQKLRLTMLERG